MHAARRTPMGLKDSTIPLGGMMVIQGKGLGPVTGINGSVPYRLRLPDDPRGTSVHLISLTDNSLVSEAAVVFASDTKVIAIVPSRAPSGATSVVVSYDGRQSRPVATTLTSSNFGIFTRNELGHGPAVAFIVDESGGKRPIGLSNPARAGQMVALRGTGLGPISTEDNGPSNTPFDVSEIDVMIGNLQVRALSAGRVLDAPAMDEIQFRIPDDASLPDGCYVPVAIRTGSTLSNFATIAKTAAGPTGGCAHHMKLSLSSLTRLDASESVNAGVFGVYRLLLETPLGTGVLSGEGAIFSKFDSNSLFSPGGLTTMTVTEGACTVYQAPALAGVSSLVPVPIAPGLDAGPTLTLTPPTLRSASLPRRSSGGYDRSGFADGALLPKELQGEWKLAGAGGSAIKAFSAMQELPPPIVWSNKDEMNEVDRGKDLMVTWQTDGEARFERVLVSGGMIRFSELYPDGVFLQFACSAPFYSGALTVPSLILQQLPASSDDDFVTFFTVANSAFDGRSSTFPASSNDGRPLDATATTYVIGEGKAVTFR